LVIIIWPTKFFGPLEAGGHANGRAHHTPPPEAAAQGPKIMPPPLKLYVISVIRLITWSLLSGPLNFLDARAHHTPPPGRDQLPRSRYDQNQKTPFPSTRRRPYSQFLRQPILLCGEAASFVLANANVRAGVTGLAEVSPSFIPFLIIA
jgi:hypothetical protein